MNKENLTPQKYNPDVCNYKHELVSQEIKVVNKDVKGLDEKIDKHMVNLKEIIKEEQKNDEKQTKQMVNKFQIAQESINVKLDKFDEAFRGNGKIGVFEQLRDVKKDINNIDEKIDKNMKSISFKFKVGFFLLILLIGGKVLGFSIDTVRGWFFPQKQVQQVNPEDIKTPDYKIGYKDIEAPL